MEEKKRILISSGHPAQVHNFKYLKEELESKGHELFWLATDKDISRYLLDHYDIEYSLLEKPTKRIFSKFSVLVKNVFRTINFIRTHKINFAVSRVSPYISVACFLLNIRHIALTDTETAGMYDKVFGRLTSAVLTSTSFKRFLRDDQIRFKGNIELFYLHPNRFQAKDDVYEILKNSEGEPYVILRFVNWDAYHDKGLSGFTDKNKKKAVEEFSKYGRVFITSENELPEQLELFRINIPPERMHDVLAHAKLFFGESATMASESAVLGRPAIFLNENWFGSTDEEQDYGLLFSYKESNGDQIAAIVKGVELLRQKNLEVVMKKNRERFLSDKIDTTAFLLWFIENWPESKQIMLDNPDYQDRFK